MKQWLDRSTGVLTMYKLVIVLLSAIGVIAILLSLFGQLTPWTPLQLLASAAVAIAFTCSTSLLFAMIMRVKPHLDSALITGLLLFFVMQPRLDLPGLAGIAVAGILASISKYLLAIRGRHIFNPAATGAFLVTLVVFATGIDSSYAAWWIGVPQLLIPVAIAAFLVLYRTQRLTVGAAFVLIAVAVALADAVLRGAPVLEVLGFTVLQSPLVFFAGFMFSEPLTLPPRRWQQLLEAVVVAVLFTVPFAFGALNKTPQFALLVGNLVGFAFGQRRGIRLDYLGKQQLGPTTWELSFRPARPVRFVAGQYMELTIPHRGADFRGSRRYFSISSAPANDGPITFAITVPEKSSSFKQALLDLEPGAIVRGTGVGGDFSLPADTTEPLLLVAGGIGITPFASQLAAATARGEKRDVTVVYANSTPGELPYADLLKESGAHVVLYAPEAPSPLPDSWVYAGPGRVTGERLAATVPDVSKRRAFVSGPPALVNDLRKALRSQGARRVHSDYFSGY
ncbi:MAG: oxidoreductase [Rhodoglobus sp.]|nr:oxidoreductase [Rhodoglobus sp.]